MIDPKIGVFQHNRGKAAVADRVRGRFQLGRTRALLQRNRGRPVPLQERERWAARFLDEDKVFGEALNGRRGMRDEPRA